MSKMSKLSLRDSVRIYDQLYQLTKTGSPLPHALHTLAQSSYGSVKKFLHSCYTKLQNGDTVQSAFLSSGTPALDASLIDSANTSGTLEYAFQDLHTLYQSLLEARSTILSHLAYPVFILHFAIFILAIPHAITSGFPAFFQAVFIPLGILYLLIFLIILFIRFLLIYAPYSDPIEKILRCIPLISSIHHHFALAKFTAALAAQLNANINIFSALEAAAKTSGSARIQNSLSTIQASLHQGNPLSQALLLSSAFPKNWPSALAVAESSGHLVETLQESQKNFLTIALSHTRTLAFWLPKILTILTLLFIGYQIISLYASYLQKVESLLP